MMEIGLVMIVSMLGNMIVSVGMPLHIGLYLGVVALAVAFKVTSTLGTLMGYLIFLVYVGSLMIAFGYSLCLYPNQRFTQPYMGLKGLSGLMMSCIFIFYLPSYSLVLGLQSHFFSSFYGMVGYVFMGVFLFFMLLVVTCLSKKDHRPMRMMFTKEEIAKMKTSMGTEFL
uniref:NADH dehydrogenase subunit 6 n=1 Tax=Limnoperna fortunei TaxID=356393 RepID=A0A0R7GSJ2_LIMFO|nr:NADH dehydrogenase subunit 6 [Limnoperna fortunei]AKP18672.1 NADH dehydrogenase subunit 6 [Limnoperna fortunei]